MSGGYGKKGVASVNLVCGSMLLAIYRYWGKAQKALEKGEKPDGCSPPYHLLSYHSLDVAAVGYLLLDPEKPLCQALARQLQVDPAWLQQWFTFCLMLHDIGKFARCFQNKCPNLSPNLVEMVPGKQDIRHDSLGFALWQKELRGRLCDIFPDGKTQRALSSWLEVVCGHHGKPPRALSEVRTTLVPEEDIPAAESFFREVITHWMPSLEPLSSIDKSAFRKTSWLLAGLTVLADWLGSDQTIFRYQSAPQSLLDYWRGTAKKQAEKVLAKSEFGSKSVTPYKSIQQQFDFIRQPTPLQQFVQTVAIPQSPQLFILEDVTGAGKTEAAMVLVHRMLSLGLAQGLYVGLPTMATANGMYSRLKDSYRSLFCGSTRPSLVLAHGASQLSDSFQETVQLAEQCADHSYGEQEVSASAYCNQWVADGRKKALMADVGVGTIDQALLAILPARHQSLRMLGLMGKVLLLDEVHAYDPYMRCLLAALLEAHAMQGGSVILLSATLPQSFRKELLNAYLRGRGLQLDSLPSTQDYPLFSQAGEQGFLQEKLSTRESVKRHVQVKRVPDDAAALDLIVGASAQGQCVCWIRNTIKDARSAWRQLQVDPRIDGDKLTLFHSRFAMVDRQAVEEDVLKRFGKESGSAQRAGQVLIATQVVEQSLDLDFDVLISDLAPVDLLIQRVGRLQRHTRSAQGNRLDDGQAEQRPAPCLHLHAPNPDAVEDDQWLRSVLPGTQSVYGHVGQLWLTARLLLQKKGFSMPEDARELIEGVYGDAAQADIPQVLQEVSDRAQGKDHASKNMGEFSSLNLDLGYKRKSGAGQGWDEDTRVRTRLDETETTRVVLTVPDEEGNLQPWAQSTNPAHRWPLSQISLPSREWDAARGQVPSRWASVIEKLQEKVKFLKYFNVLPMVKETECLYNSRGGWDMDRKESHESD